VGGGPGHNVDLDVIQRRLASLLSHILTCIQSGGSDLIACANIGRDVVGLVNDIADLAQSPGLPCP
jgi:hypothetical protein